MAAEERVSDAGTGGGTGRGTRTVAHATCLGCGCACDDITVIVRDGRIVEAQRACSLGAAWFGDGRVPARVISEGRDVDVDRAIDDATSLLTSGGRALVYLAGDVSCEVQRAGVAIADQLRAALDILTTATALPSILAAQRRGRASATLGEIRNRANILVFWGVDPAARYPRYTTRYAPDPEGIHVPGGRSDRLVIAVDIGDTRALASADERVHFADDEEIPALTLMRAAILGWPIADSSPDDLAARARGLVRQMIAARYVAVVVDGEPSRARVPGRAEALIMLTQALNGPTRCALSTLRAGNNRSGAEAVLTWQTGFPLAVDFARGVPRYRPDEGATVLLTRDEVGVALVLGDPTTIPAEVTTALARVPTIVIGPRASASTFGPRIAIDTGVAGIHEGGMAMRMDDVPLPLRPALTPTIDTLATANALAQRLANSTSVTAQAAIRAGRPQLQDTGVHPAATPEAVATAVERGAIAARAEPAA
ncbi:MAG TPA: hypothetical protein VFJ96_11935 [Gemmatimonadaceae bacterium]|nr:hypothetical protein [Gemmatimonadaceae bacterium]